MHASDLARPILRPFVLAALTLAANAGAQGTTPCAGSVGCQLSDQNGWALSDDNPNGGLWALDNFKVQGAGAITSVCWWGVYYDFDAGADCAPGTGDDFTITYFEDVACKGMPGALRAGPFRVSLALKAPTGNIVSAGGISLLEFQYSAAHPAVPVAAGECLWIEILNHQTQKCFWMWSTAQPGDGRAVQSGIFGPNPTTHDLAFCVDVATYAESCAGDLATTYCSAKLNSAGCTPAIAAGFQGLNVVVRAEQVLPAETGLLFYGTAGAASVPFQGGFLCVQGPISRTAAQSAGSAGSPPCSGTYAFDFTAHAASGVDPALSGGAQVWVQYWSRDSAAVAGSGLTDALTFQLCP